MGGRGWETHSFRHLPSPPPAPHRKWVVPFANIAVDAPIPGRYVESVKSQKNQDANVERLKMLAYKTNVVDLLVRIGYSIRAKRSGTPCDPQIQLFQIQHKALRVMYQRSLGYEFKKQFGGLEVPVVECGFRFGRQILFCALDRLFHRGVYRTTTGPNPKKSDIGHEYMMLNQMWLGEDTMGIVKKALLSFPPTRTFLGGQYTTPQLQDIVDSFLDIAKFIRLASMILYTDMWARQNGSRRTELPNSYAGKVHPELQKIKEMLSRREMLMPTRSVPKRLHKTTFENMNNRCRWNLDIPDNAALLRLHNTHTGPRGFGMTIKNRQSKKRKL